MHAGRWKLVYADFVTVLMAFFIVAWIMLFDLISKEKKIDRGCTDRVAQQVKLKMASDPAIIKGKEPIQVLNDYSIFGVRFTLVDSTKAMFESGRSAISEFAKPQFDLIAEAVKSCPPDHKLRIEGYTDGAKYAGGDFAYGNWELSSDRAQSARRELLKRGIEPSRISDVTGYGDSRLALPDDPKNPLNRRVSITIMAPFKDPNDKR